MEPGRWTLALLCLLAGCVTPPLSGPSVPEQPRPVPSAPAPAAPPPVLPAVLRQGADARTLAANCLPCHGVDGNSRGAIPSIAGQSADYLQQTLWAYRRGERFATIMDRLMAGYSGREIAQLAGWFAQLPRRTEGQRVEPGQLRLGRRLHRRYCRECHTGQGDGTAESGVWLAGQRAGYLRAVLDDYLVGYNRGDQKMEQRLRELVSAEGRAGIEALISYYAGYRPEASPR